MSNSATDLMTNASILVVDTCGDSLVAIASVLIAEHHQVQTAAGYDQAFELAQRETLDLLITENRLGHQTGEELFRRIRRLPGQSDLPVMYMTNNQTPDVIRRCHESVAAFHLKKPIDAQVLSQLVEKALWMPHLVKSHIQQKTVQQPHVAFAKNPLASVLEVDALGSFPMLPGTPITF